MPNPIRIKAILKSLASHALYFPAKHVIKNNSNKLLILTYHRVLPDVDPRTKFEQPGMYVHPGTFETHLIALKEQFEFTFLTDWPLKKTTSSKPLCAITFDDGWKDNFEFAYPLLKKHDIPATIFLVSNLIGSQKDFWPGRLARVLHFTATKYADLFELKEFDWLKALRLPYAFSSEPPNKAQLDFITNSVKSYSEEDIHKYLDTLEAVVSLPNKLQNPGVLLNQHEIFEMRDSGLITYGSHTSNHTRLNDFLSEDDIISELTESKKDIEALTGKEIQLFCYPNGDHSELAEKHAKRIYKMSCTTKKGWNSNHTPKHLLKRINLHEEMSNNKIKFTVKISGLL